jgi:hypothetical protein
MPTRPRGPSAGRARLAAAAALVLTGPPAAAAADTITVVPTPGQRITIVAAPAAATHAPALAAALAPHAAAVGRWAGERRPATVFLVADRAAVPDTPDAGGEVPGAQIEVERSALHLWVGLVPQTPDARPPGFTRVVSNFLVRTSLRQLAGARPRPLPAWIPLGLLDQASLAPAQPVDPAALDDAPFLALLHPVFNDPFIELLARHPALGTAVARTIIEDLFSRWPPARMGDLIRALRVQEFEAAFGRVYGRSFDGYAEELERTLGTRRRL